MTPLATRLARRTPEPPAAERELRERLTEAHLQLVQRDEEIRRLLHPHAEAERLRGELERLRSEHLHAREQLDAMRVTRVWRAGMLYWRLRGWLLGR
jgi:hypothetical protein